jgi:large subunit ribosomal protein L10
MARAKKDEFIARMKDNVQRAQGVLFVDFTGITVQKVDVLRRRLQAAGSAYHVVKNTLMGRVLEGTPYAGASACFKGTPTGVVLGYEDPVTPAKLTYAFIKECDKVRVKGGVVDNQAISAAQAAALADMPSREELQGMVVALAKSPGARIAGAIKSPSGNIVGAIEALCDRLGEAG